MTSLESFSLLIAMNRLCRIAYSEGLLALTDDERRVLLCFAGFDPRYVKQEVVGA